MNPVEGVRNAGVENLYGFRLEDDSLVFVARQWTTLSANDFGDAFPFCDGRRGSSRKVLIGELDVITASPRYGEYEPKNPYPYSPWKIEGPSFVSTEAEYDLTNQFSHTILVAGQEGYNHAFTLRTVKQLTRVVAWRTQESSGPVRQQTFWSRRSLADWHLLADWHIPMDREEMEGLWKRFRLSSLI